jgi:hypothetical protein
MQAFLKASVGLTGFSAKELEATGLVDFYQNLVLASVSEAAVARIAETADDGFRALARDVAGVAQDIAILWYTGAWPPGGREPSDVLAAGPDGYAQALVWKAFGALPPGAAQPGYGSWALKPVPAGPHDVEESR